MRYQHTQTGTLMIGVTIAVFLLFGNILMKTELNIPMAIFMGLILCLLASFSSLQVTIDEQYLKIKFGYGIFRKQFLLKDIISAQTVKNRWYYGWGIRHSLFSNIWIFNGTVA